MICDSAVPPAELRPDGLMMLWAELESALTVKIHLV